MKKIIMLLLGFAGLHCTYAQKSPSKQQEVFEFTTRNITTGTISSDVNYTFQFRLLKKTDQNRLFECKLVKINYKGNTDGIPVNINTENIRNTKFESSNGLFALAILQQPIQLTVYPNGNLFRADGFQEAIESAIVRWKLSADYANGLRNELNYIPKSDLGGLFLQLPAKPLVSGTEWTTEYPRITYKVTGVKGDIIQITSSADNTDNLQTVHNTGTYSFNKKTGWIESAKKTGKTESLSYKINTVYTQKINYAKNKYQPDTAWLSMAAKMSPFSDFLTSNGKYDTLKVYRFFRANDLLYKNDRYYIFNKLSLLNSPDDKNSNKLYHELLAATSNSSLEDEPMHLYNKLNFYDENVDSAYQVSRHMLKGEALNEWLQYSFYQRFTYLKEADSVKTDVHGNQLSEKEINDLNIATAKRIVRSNELLDLLHQDKNPLMQQKVNALYLWVKAKKQPSDTLLLLKIADEFKLMNDVSMIEGNGGRYALATYTLLVDAKRKKKADELLSKTIEKLERYANDSLNKRRNADRNLLVHAYYLKYLATTENGEQAVKYLAKSVQYTPKNGDKKDYITYYDNPFLNSKESYREEFIKALFKNGSFKEVKHVFSDQISAEPGLIYEIQKAYQHNFPNEDFKTFFAENVVASWPAAPEFTLKDLQGRNHTLTDLKDKWTVVDFWGTWCGPCREEMPALNAFHKEIQEGKHDGVRFFSVACQDHPVSVGAYLKENQFNIPVVMSDGSVERKFNIRSYPHKVIISPDGRMMAVNYGTDWKSVVKKFNELYAKN